MRIHSQKYSRTRRKVGVANMSRESHDIRASVAEKFGLIYNATNWRAGRRES